MLTGPSPPPSPYFPPSRPSSTWLTYHQRGAVHRAIPRSPTSRIPGRQVPDLACSACGHTDREDVMLVCDSCPAGWHIDCLTPPLAAVPPEEEPWQCPDCIRTHVPLPQGTTQLAFEPLSPAAMRKLAIAAALHGRIARRRFNAGWFLGRVSFLGHWAGHRCLGIVYEDGDQHDASVEQAMPWLLPPTEQWPTHLPEPGPYKLHRDDLERQATFERQQASMAGRPPPSPVRREAAEPTSVQPSPPKERPQVGPSGQPDTTVPQAPTRARPTNGGVLTRAQRRATAADDFPEPEFRY